MKELNRRFNHEKFGLRSQYALHGQHLTINDELPHRIIAGSILVKPNVAYFTKTGVVFDDGSEVRNLDAVIFCTGYKIGFKFVDQSILRVTDNKVELYKYVFPPSLAKPTLAVIGCIQPRGAVFPLSELQARWATLVFCGKKSLPPASIIMKDIKTKRLEMEQRYYASNRHTIQVSNTACLKDKT